LHSGKHRFHYHRKKGIWWLRTLFIVWFVLTACFPISSYAAEVEVDQVTGLEIEKDAITLIEGQSTTLKTFLLYASGKKETAKNVEWSIDPNPYVSVESKTGKIAVTNSDGGLVEETFTVTAKYKKNEEEFEDTVDVTAKRKEITGVSSASSLLSLLVGEEKPVSLTVTYNDGKTGKVTDEELAKDIWKITPEDDSVVSAENGKLKAIGQGITKVTVEYNDNPQITTSFMVDVYKISEMEVTPTTIELIEGQTATPRVNFIYSNGKKIAAKGIKWSSLQPEYASVDANGKITAVSSGTATITADYSDGGYEGGAKEIEVTVIPKATQSVTPTPASLAMLAGQKKQIKLTVTQNDGKKLVISEGIEWESSNEEIVKVDKSGNVTAVAAELDSDGIPVKQGRALLTATYDGRDIVVPVTVDDVKRIELSSSLLTLIEGQTGSFKPYLVYTNNKQVAASKGIEWKIQEEAAQYIKLDSTGKITATKAPESEELQKVEVYYQVSPGKQLSAEGNVKVKEKVVTNLVPSFTSLSMVKGETKNLKLTAFYNDGKSSVVEVPWIPDDPVVVGVDGETIVAKEAGTVILTAEYGGKTATVRIVVHGIDRIEVTPASLALVEGQSQTLRATVVYKNNKKITPADIVWSSSDSGVAAVEKGKVQAVFSGSATITAEYMGVPSTGVNVVVTSRQITSLSVAPTNMQMMPGDSKPLTVTATYSDGKKETIPVERWKDSVQDLNPTVARIVDGKVVALDTGQASFIISYGGKQANASVTVGKSAQLQGIEVSPTSFSLFEGQTADIKVMLVYDNGKKVPAPWDGPPLTFKYDGNNASPYVQISNGKVTGKQASATPVIVTAEYGALTFSPISVSVMQKQVTGFNVTPVDLNLLVGESVQLKASITTNDGKTTPITTGISWVSDDPGIASADGGKVKGLSPGNTIVTASYNGQEIKIPVAIHGPEKIEVSPTSLQLIEGQTGKLQATLVYSNGVKAPIEEGIVWESEDENSVFVKPETGEITAIASSDEPVSITASFTTGSGEVLTGAVDVIVTPKKVVDLTFSPTKVKLLVGEMQQISLIAKYNDGSTKDVTEDADWVSVNEDVATVGNERREDSATEEEYKGMVKANSPGTSTIEADYEGITATFSGLNTNTNAVSLSFPKTFATARNVSPHKTWSVRFNRELDPATVNEKNVVVTDEKNHRMDVKVRLVEGNTIEISYAKGYEPGKQYYVTVKRNVTSKDGQKLKENVRMPFVIKK
jgi:uncharacterized protein YjdB